MGKTSSRFWHALTVSLYMYDFLIIFLSTKYRQYSCQKDRCCINDIIQICLRQKKMMMICVMLLISVRGDKLVISSSNRDDITIDGGPAYVYGSLTFSSFPFSSTIPICGPEKDIPDGAEFTVEHLFKLECQIPLIFCGHANQGFTAYLNGQICAASKQLYNNCSIPHSVPTYASQDSCGFNNLTIIVNNLHQAADLSGTTHPSYMTYQLVQTNDEDCPALPDVRCPKPLTWYPFPVCACECGYTSSCGPGFKWNGRPSTYGHTHRKQTK